MLRPALHVPPKLWRQESAVATQSDLLKCQRFSCMAPKHMHVPLHADKTLPGFLLLKCQLQLALFNYWRGFRSAPDL